jgi:hypothetical protein
MGVDAKCHGRPGRGHATPFTVFFAAFVDKG